MKKHKSWIEKLNDPKPHEIKPAPVGIAGMRAGQIMLVPTPKMIDAFIRAIPVGACMDVKTMRGALAARHGAEVTCPIYTGFHLRTVAEAACEELERGLPVGEVTPFWRVLNTQAPTTRKLARGESIVARQRALEGLAP